MLQGRIWFTRRNIKTTLFELSPTKWRHKELNI